MNVVELSISGNDNQETRSGKNIYKPFGQKTMTTEGVTVTINEDNSITLNGTCTKAFWAEILYNLQNGSSAQTKKIIDLDPVKKYTFSLRRISGKVNNQYVNATFQLNAEGDGIGGPTITTTNPDGTSKTTQGTEGYDGIYRTYLYIPQGAIFTDLVFGVQVEEGETMTEYERYGAMPSPEYPSKVETVGDNVNIFDKDNVNKIDGYISGSNKTIYNSVEGTKILYIECEGNTAYTVSKKLSARFVVGSIDTIPDVNGICSKIENNANAKSITITTDKNDTYLCVYYYSASVDTLTEQEILDSIKIEKDTVASAYSSYNMGCASVVVSNGNLYNNKDMYDINQSIEYKEDDFLKCTYDNTSSSATVFKNFFTNASKLIKPNKEYWIVLEIKECSGSGKIQTLSTGSSIQLNNWQDYNFSSLTPGKILIRKVTSSANSNNASMLLRSYCQFASGESGSITFRLSISPVEVTAENFKYVPFMLQTKTVDIQQPMLEGDYFVKEEDGWKEVHGWNKKIFDGTENFRKITGDTNKYYFGIQNFGNNMNYAQKSNYFKGGKSFWGENEEGVYIGANRELVFGVSIDNKEGINDLETWKNWLTQKYNEGNPIYVWYKLATPTKLTCTEKQSAQLDDLLNTSTYKNITHIYSTDKVSPIIKIKYRKDIETMLNNQQSEYETRLNNIEKLLSTTTTSALLLDNLQSDLEKEVL